MSCLVLLSLIVSAFVALNFVSAEVISSAEVAGPCNAAACELPDCACSSVLPPAGVNNTIPQFVVLSFDDSVTELIYTTYYEPDLLGRVNPDGCPISATFYVPHEYSDYYRVNDLYNQGFEIAVNSITKNSLASYWLEASRQDLIDEFGGQREIISNFANIPIEDIVGARTPLLQINGNYTYEALRDSDFLYDNSRPTRSSARLFPYTMDYESTQQCLISPCPDESIPGFWILPIQNWVDENGTECSTLFSCSIASYNENAILQWMISNFELSYNSQRSPFTVLVNSAWFLASESTHDAFIRFLDYLGTLPDVYVVSSKQVIEWAQNPSSEVNSCSQNAITDCNHVTCQLMKEGTDIRYMSSCVPCPEVYPWLGNPLGL